VANWFTIVSSGELAYSRVQRRTLLNSPSLEEVQWPMAGSCEQDNETSGSIKDNFLTIRAPIIISTGISPSSE
jgi:hypothetical protein